MKITQNIVPYVIPTPNNMEVVRYVLAIAVMIAHFNVSTGSEFFFPVSSYDGVGGFFALSGFLIYGSFLKRKSPRQYILSRAIRLLPAYFSTVLFFAMVLCLLSTVSFAQYFTSGHFWKYLTSNLAFLNFLEPTLPGVFTAQPIEAVNGSLWTMKVEWFLYLSVPIVAWLIHKFRFKCTRVFIVIYIFSALYALTCQIIFQRTGNPMVEIMGRQFMGQMMFFYAGVLIYYYFDAFLKYKYIIIASAILILFSAEWSLTLFIVLRPLSIAVLVIGLSMIGKWGTVFGKHDNVSYNMYLIHFPVIQILVSTGTPGLLGTGCTFAVYFIAVIILSVCLNKFIELPVQRALRQSTAISG